MTSGVLTSPTRVEAALAQTIAPAAVTAISHDAYAALQRRDYGGSVGIVRARSRGLELARTPRLVDAANAEGLLLLELNVRGRTAIAQHDREAAVGAGWGVLYATSEPYRLRLADDNLAYLVSVPRASVPLPDRVLRHAAARPIDARLPSHQLLRRYVDAMFGLAAVAQDAEAASLARTTLVELVRGLASTIAGAHAQTSREALLAALQDTVRRDLADPDLTPAALARRHHVSLRSVHAAFETTDTTAAAHIRAQRLERATQLLADPHLRIVDVALACGFRGSTSFVRAFTAAHGMAPSAYRARASA